ncbi:KH domain-containing, RNA-binding, signal transduction-associated protein 3 [Gopherus flavomarginatus]|uniref:KH domain-containing, RNA-binding, signal transduction-associated protein 3 n=1 Tax=Gopherus flavomarginatus TaxID=286002 RepID=UPI0021CB9E24|nr:KH domain-containing, RNA-binding, signal transduction-associated protein 3 [Gopherus flavomarginatus]
MDEKYLPELMAEKDSLDPSFTHALRLVNQEIEKFQKGEGKEEEKYIDVVINKNMKLGQKVLIPVKQFPKDYNDEIRQAQLQELTYLNGGSENAEVPVVRGKPPIRARGVPVPALARGRGGVPPPPAGVPRGAPAPRGVPPSRGPVSRARGLLAPRARGVPLPAGYRPLPPPPAQETYGEYEYDDGYGTAYDEQGYDSYDNSYSTQAQSGTDYYDYGHGLNEETYDSYGQEEWTNSRHKAPSARTTKGIYRDQPYARY